MGTPLDDDGGLVVATSESMTCLSCLHSDACGHKHAAGRALARQTHPAHHTLNDMDKYRHLVHSALSDDGTRLRLRGKSTLRIDWASVKATFAMTTLHLTVRHTHSADVDDDDMDLLATGTSPGRDSTRSPSTSPTQHSECSAHGTSTSGIAGGGDGGTSSALPAKDNVDMDRLGPETGLGGDCTGNPSPSPTQRSDRSLNGSSTGAVSGHGDNGAGGGVADSALLAIGRRFRSDFVPNATMTEGCFLNTCPCTRGSWCATNEDTVHELTDDPLRDALCPRHDALVFHVGACYAVSVRGPYDGARDGLINMGKFLFTYEFLQAFLDQLYGSASTFRQYLLCALRGYVRTSAGSSLAAREHALCLVYLHQMNSHSRTGTGSRKCYQAFVNAVLDFISLQVRAAGARVLMTHWPRKYQSVMPMQRF